MVSDILCGTHVLAIHRSNVHGFGLLGFVRMLRPGVNAQVTELHAAQWSTRNHALDGLLDDALGKTAFEDRLGRTLLDAADEAGVVVIDLVVALASRQHGVSRIDDDDMVAAVDMRCVGRKVFAAKSYRDQGSEPADHRAFGVDQHPLLRHLGWFRRKRFHVRKSGNGKRRVSAPDYAVSRSVPRARQPQAVVIISIKTKAYKYGVILP